MYRPQWGLLPVVVPAKGDYERLRAIRTRHIAKVRLHVAMSLLAMNAAAVVNAADGSDNIRRCIA